MEDQKVEKYVQDLQVLDSEKADIVISLRKLVSDIAPDAQEKMMYGGIVFMSGRLVCGIFARKKYVTVEFDRGVELDDPKGLLEGGGKYRRHLKLYDHDDIKHKQAVYYIKQSFKL